MDRGGNRLIQAKIQWIEGALGVCYVVAGMTGVTSYPVRVFHLIRLPDRVIELLAAAILIGFAVRRIVSVRRDPAGGAPRLSAGELGAIVGLAIGLVEGLSTFAPAWKLGLFFAATATCPIWLVVGAVACAWGSQLWGEIRPIKRSTADSTVTDRVQQPSTPEG
jgi:hypothetical protein